MTAFYMSLLYQHGPSHLVCAGPCPIEDGRIGKLADHECEHGRLPGDRTAPCGCWMTELVEEVL